MALQWYRKFSRHIRIKRNAIDICLQNVRLPGIVIILYIRVWRMNKIKSINEGVMSESMLGINTV